MNIWFERSRNLLLANVAVQRDQNICTNNSHQ